MNAVFITGTDTGVGKTLISGLLARYLQDSRRSVITQKWIQTGSNNFPEDIASHLQLMGVDRSTIEKHLPDMCPYTFHFPASPHLAAAMEQKTIDEKKIKDSFARLSASFDTVVVEGIGGALVPYSDKALVIDIAANLDLPVIIVAKNKLGAINHTLLTIEAIHARRMKLLGLIFNADENENSVIAQDNPKSISSLTNVRILGCLPWTTSPKILHQAFKPIGDNIMTTSAKGVFNE